MGDILSMPVFAPLFTPGTERVTVRWLTVQIPVSREISTRVLPGNLCTASEPTLGLWIAEFIGAEFHSPQGIESRPDYMQGGVSLRCTVDEGPHGAYAIETFVEGLNHGILGREIFGLPKKQAQSVTLEEHDDSLEFGITSAQGQNLVTGSATFGKTPEFGTAPTPPWFDRHLTVKAIPSAEGTGYDLCKLVEIPWHMTPQHSVLTGEAELQWGADDSDPLHVFVPTGRLTATYGIATLEIGYGTYLGDATLPAPVGTPNWK